MITLKLSTIYGIVEKGLDASRKILILDNNGIRKIEGLEQLSQLRILQICDNKITKIEGLEELSQLQQLSLGMNKITKIERLEKLTQLKELDLSNNEITKIEGLEQLTQLQKLNLSGNKITKIEGLEQLVQLRELDLSYNKIRKIKGLEQLTQLQILRISNNKITKMEGLEQLTQLQILDLSFNKIRKIKGLEQLTQLQSLYLSENKITEVPFSIMNLRSLTTLAVGCDINPIIKRFLNRNLIKSNKLAVYHDSQNVHDSNINRSIADSIFRLLSSSLSYDDVLKDILGDDYLTTLTKDSLIEYSNIDDVHSILNVTFKEVLCSVWYIIKNHENAVQIKEILNDEMNDSLCKCFTGRLSRLVNCLNGFDERVTVRMSESSEISNIIIMIREKYEDVEDQKREVDKELKERGYGEDVITEWVSYL